MEVSYNKVVMEDGVEVYLPNLELKMPPVQLNQYGKLRIQYLKKMHPIQFQIMKLAEELTPDLQTTQQAADLMQHTLMEKMQKEEHWTEERKAQEPEAWAVAEKQFRRKITAQIIQTVVNQPPSNP